MNYFAAGVDARRYAQARPAVHRSAVAAFRLLAPIDKPLARALDVGCGTGQSSVALASIATTVVGVDPSSQMLSHAAPNATIHYVQATAERLPLADESFQLITAGLAFHWFDPGAFLSEVRRVLRPLGWLVIYTSAFSGEMLENPGFARWFRDDFLARYPIPARNQIPISPLVGDAHGLSWIGEQRFSDDVRMSLETFVDYELSTTNIIATVGHNPAALERAEAWLAASVAPLFRHREAGTFRFVGKVWCLRKLAPDVWG